MNRHRPIPLLIVFSSVFLAGCGSKNEGPKLHSVKGKIVQGEMPVAGVQVTFVPVSGAEKVDAQIPFAITNDKGEFELATKAKAGAPEGEYKVTLSTNVPPDASGKPITTPNLVLDPKFNEAATTPLSAKVPGGSYTFDIAK